MATTQPDISDRTFRTILPCRIARTSRVPRKTGLANRGIGSCTLQAAFTSIRNILSDEDNAQNSVYSANPVASPMVVVPLNAQFTGCTGLSPEVVNCIGHSAGNRTRCNSLPHGMGRQSPGRYLSDVCREDPCWRSEPTMWGHRQIRYPQDS